MTIPEKKMPEHSADCRYAGEEGYDETFEAFDLERCERCRNLHHNLVVRGTLNRHPYYGNEGTYSRWS